MGKPNHRQSNSGNKGGQKPKPSSDKDSNDTPSNQSQSNAAKRTNAQPCHQPPKIIVNTIQQDDTVAKHGNRLSYRANWINVVAVVVNFSLLVATYYIFQAAKKQFLIGNKPFLEISIPVIKSPPEIGKTMIFTFDIRNFGVYPVQVLDAKFGQVVRKVAPDINEVYKDGETSALNKYVAKEMPQYITVGTPNPPLSKEHYDAMKTGGYHLFFYGYINYKNLITDSISEYRFIIREDIFEGAADYVLNTNISK